MKTSFTRLGIYAALATTFALVAAPSSAHAQFGALKKAKEALEKAKAAKAKVDSVQATVENAKALVDGVTGSGSGAPAVTINEEIFGKFTVAYALEKVAIKDKQAKDALEFAASTAQLPPEQYAAAKVKIEAYANAKAGKGEMPALTESERKLLDTHEATINALVAAKK